MQRVLGAPIPVWLLLALSVSSLRAQVGQAELTGEVRDPQGAVVPGAVVMATEVQTNLAARTVASANGSYTMTNLRPGSYRVTAQVQGFKQMVREGVILKTGERVRLDFDLVLGEITESIRVVADAPLLRTDTGSLGQVISNRTIVEIPLNGRNYLGLVGLAAGVANPPGGITPRINGGRPRTNEFLYDGLSVLQPEPGQVAFYPIIEAIQEFKLEINSPPAEFGRFNGGVINLTTKSGTKEFHGALFEFFRNEALNARNLFAPAAAANPHKPVFRRNQFGGVLGGPIYRDNSFFFVDYQGTKQVIGRVRTSTVPTLLQRHGIFTEAVAGAVARIYDPSTTTPADSGFTRTQFANGAIPQNRIDPVALTLLNRYPVATSPGTANNYTRVGNEPDDQRQFDVRVDHRFSDRNVVYGRYSQFRANTSPVTPLPDGSGSLTTGVLGPTTVLGQSYAANYVHVFSERMTNEMRFGHSRRTTSATATQLSGPVSSVLGLPGIPTNYAFPNTLPTFNIAGVQSLGSPANSATGLHTDTAEVVNALSFRRGNHSFKAGLDWRWERLNIQQPSQPTGVFNFSTLFSDLPSVTGTGNALASFLLGQVNTFSIDLQQRVMRPRARIQEYFFQDDWKVSRRLTVNAGVRYTLNFPSTEVDNQGAIFNLKTQQLDYLGKDGFPRSGRTLHKLNFGPRLGLAYRIKDKTVVRAAYAVVFIEMSGCTTPFCNPQFPFLQTATQRTLDNLNPAFALSRGPSIAPASLTPDAGLGQGVFTVDRGLGSGYVQQWNLAIQRQLTSDFVFEVAYAGNKITHICIPDTNINQLPVDLLKMGNALLATVPNPYFGIIPRQSSLGNPTIPAGQLLRRFPRFTSVTFFRNNVGNTHYDSLQAKLEKRMSRGFAFLLSYTRSKLMEDASQVLSNTLLTGPTANYSVADTFNRRLERDVSMGDMPNVFAGSWTYELPFSGKLLGGWQVSGVLSLQSGLPLAVSQATNFNAFAGFGVQRPNRVSNPENGAPRTTAQWFNTSAFQTAPQFTLGSSSRNPVRGPAYRNTAIALIKRTPVRERMNLELRAEVFNLTNTPPLGAPAVVQGAAGFGSITSAGDPRVVQLALKLNF